MFCCLKEKKGQSLLEVVVSIAFFAFASGAVFLLLQSQILRVRYVQQATQATNYAAEGIHAVRSMRDRDWNTLTAGVYGLSLTNGQWNFATSTALSDGMTRSVTIAAPSTGIRNVQVSVHWVSASAVSESTSLQTTLTNWKTATPPLLSGDWKNLRTLGTIDIGPGNAAVGLAVTTSSVYIAANASDEKKSDIFAVGILNPSSPVLLGDKNTSRGGLAIAVKGTYAYLGNESSTKQVQVIDIHNLNEMEVVANLSLPNNSSSVLSAAISGSVLYVGTAQSSGNELFAIDVSNPRIPVVLGSLEMNADVNDIFFYNNRLYLATSRDTSELVIVNPQTPSAMVVSGSYNAAGDGDGHGVYVNSQDSHLYLARKQGTQAADPDVLIFSLATPDSPVLLGTLDTNTSVNAVFAADNLMFLATENANLEFQVYDVSNPAAPLYYSGLNFPQNATRFVFLNNMVFVSVRSNDALRIITSS